MTASIGNEVSDMKERTVESFEIHCNLRLFTMIFRHFYKLSEDLKGFGQYKTDMLLL